MLIASTVSPYEPVTAGEHIAAKLNGSRNGRKNPAAVRVAARARAATK
ncbi:hypothetical protein [Streptomyces sp. NPDC059863]